jgi:hypothetical protein
MKTMQDGGDRLVQQKMDEIIERWQEIQEMVNDMLMRRS